MRDTHSKTALVTGATSGIGRAVAIGFAAAGYNVAVLARRRAELEAVVELCGKRTLGRVCDVTDPLAVSSAFGDAVARFGRIDVLFNNAGRFSAASEIAETEVAAWRDMVDVNLNGAFYVAREAFRVMRDQTPQGGRIINNGSISAHAPRPHSVSYAATKHAISGLTKAISLDGRPYSIACGQIDIGNTATDMTAQMNKGMLQADGSLRPEPTFDVRYVVKAVLFMADLPLDTNVQEMTIMATNMPYVGRG